MLSRNLGLVLNLILSSTSCFAAGFSANALLQKKSIVGIAQITPEEGTFLSALYAKHSASDICKVRDPSRCRWPSCRLLRGLFLDDNDCDALSSRMRAQGVTREAGSRPLILFLQRNPDLMRAIRRRSADAVLQSTDQHYLDQSNVSKKNDLSAYFSMIKLGNEFLCFPPTNELHDMLERNTYYFPHPAAGSKGPCVLDQPAEALRFLLANLSSPKECVAKHQITTGSISFGLGALISSWLKPLMFAVDSGFSFWSPPLGPYKDGSGSSLGRTDFGKRCSLNDMRCFFKPLSKCENEKVLTGCNLVTARGTPREKNITGGTSCTWNLPVTNGPPLREYSHVHLFDEQRYFDKDGSYPTLVPLAFRKMGYFWYMSNLIHFMLASPNDYFSQVLIDAKAAAKWRGVERPLLSMHVRHGDSCTKAELRKAGRMCEPLDVYMHRAVLPLADRYAIKSIFLATDDNNVIHDTGRWPQFKWFFIPGQERGGLKNISWTENMAKKKFDNFIEAQSTLVDMSLMSEGDAFVGKFTSNIDRLTYALQVAKKQSLVPYVSLDSTWCMDHGQQAGTSFSGDGGRFTC